MSKHCHHVAVKQYFKKRGCEVVNFLVYQYHCHDLLGWDMTAIWRSCVRKDSTDSLCSSVNSGPLRRMKLHRRDNQAESGIVWGGVNSIQPVPAPPVDVARHCHSRCHCSCQCDGSTTRRPFRWDIRPTVGSQQAPFTLHYLTRNRGAG